MTGEECLSTDPDVPHQAQPSYMRKQALDPMDLLPPGSFGRELATTALARFLKLQ